MISGAYPGLLNGLMTSLLYEDHWFQVVDSFDCLLLSRYFGLGGGGPFGPPRVGRRERQPALPRRRRAAARLRHEPVQPRRQVLAEDRLHRRRADRQQRLGLCRAARHATVALGLITNPSGTRCTIQDYLKYVFGVGPDNKAPRPIDNVGLQYGLQNLLNGTLSKRGSSTSTGASAGWTSTASGSRSAPKPPSAH